MNQHIDLSKGTLQSLLKNFDYARNDYMRRTGKEPTHIVLDVATYQALCMEINPPVAADAELSMVLGMEIVVAEDLSRGVSLLARRP